MVPIYAMLLFGGELEVNHEMSVVTLDKWARFNAPAKCGVLISELRGLVSALLSHKLSHPLVDISEEPEVRAMHQLLSSDGY